MLNHACGNQQRRLGFDLLYINENPVMKMMLWNLAKTCEVDSDSVRAFENDNEAIKCV